MVEKLTENQLINLNKILDKYKNSYPNYELWEKKTNYFNRENELISQFQFEDYKIGNINLGYLLSKDKKIQLDDNFIKFIFLRYDGLQSCICEKEFYIENNKDKNTCDEQKNLNFLKKELKKIEDLISEYKKKYCDIESDKEKKIEFVKKICETINWGFEDINTGCEKILKNEDLHRKTFGINKQRVLGNSENDLYETYIKCNMFFNGLSIGKFYSSCHKAVEWTMILNKYGVLSAYFKKAPFIRFLLNNGLIMPHRRFPQIKKEDIKGTYIDKLVFGLYKFSIYLNNDNFELYDDENFKILPPLLHSAKTVTYSEFRDLLCYLNLPVFRSTVNRNILFFPSYDQHQRLLAIQGLPRNYCDYTGKSMDWKWFKEGETAAKEAIKCFCQEYEESPGYGIEPVEYVWYDIVYPDSGNIKKFIFLVVPFEDLDYYTGSDIYKRDGKYYICNKDEVPDHMVPQFFEQKKLKHIDYIWYKEYLFFTTPFNETYHFNDFDIFKKDTKIYICNKKVPESMMGELLMQTKLESVEHIWFNNNLFFVVAITDLDKYKYKYGNLYIFKKDEKYYIYYGNFLQDYNMLIESKILEKVQYFWHKKFIFIKVPTNIPGSFRINKNFYICNYDLEELKEGIDILKGIEQKKKFKEKYIKYKTKYLNLKNFYSK